MIGKETETEDGQKGRINYRSRKASDETKGEEKQKDEIKYLNNVFYYISLLRIAWSLNRAAQMHSSSDRTLVHWK